MDRITNIVPPDVRNANNKGDKKDVASSSAQGAQETKQAKSTAQTNQTAAQNQRGGVTDRVQIDGQNEKIAQISQFLESLERVTQVIRETQSVLDSVRGVLADAKTIAAEGKGDEAKTLVNSIDQIVGDALAQRDLLVSSDNNLTTPILEKPSVPFVINGMDVSVSALGLGGADSLTDVSLGLADEQVMQIKQYLDDGLRKIQNSRNFSENVLQTINLVEQSEIKSQSEEAANLLALQTRQMLSDITESLTSEAQKAVVNLIGQP